MIAPLGPLTAKLLPVIVPGLIRSSNTIATLVFNGRLLVPVAGLVLITLGRKLSAVVVVVKAS